MPELPEVETVCRGLNLVTCKQQIFGGEVLLERSIAFPLLSKEMIWQDLVTLSIHKWTRRGKYLIANLLDREQEPSGSLVVHLRMTGQLLWLRQDSPISKHTRVRFFFGDFQELRFVDIRTFGKIWLVPKGKKPEDIVTGIQTLGVEPLLDQFTTDYLAQKFQNCKTKIKTLLLDQRVVAGVGNIYADEALFESKIHPETSALSLDQAQLENLRKAIINVLQRGIENGGTTIKDFRSVSGINGNYGGVAWVYGRAKSDCRICGTLIEKIKLGGRSSHFCPYCQPKSLKIT